MDIKNVRVIIYGDKIFKHADIVKVTTVKNNVYIGQIMPGDENGTLIFELCLEDEKLMPFGYGDATNIEKADELEIFNYAYNLGRNTKIK